jgi:hypothetical protein
MFCGLFLFNYSLVVYSMTKTKKLRGLSLRANYTDRRLSTKLVPSFADRGCRVVSATDPYGSILVYSVTLSVTQVL